MLNRQVLLDVFLEQTSLSRVDAQAFPTTCLSPLEQEKIAEFRAKYQAYNLNRKAEAETVSEAQRKSAWDDFLWNQESMRAYNHTFAETDILKEARRIIHDLLPCLGYVEEDMWPLCSFGPGTFHGAVKTALGSSTHYKVGGDQTVTQLAKPLAIEVILKFFPNWAEHLGSRRLRTVKGNRPSHVPKDVAKCRPISIEPSLNVFLQQGVGRWLGRYMKMVGFADIHHGQARNRALAQDLSNGTIDLSSASDTISRSLVKYLVPGDWFVLMDTIRSHGYNYRGQEGIYENFSSQGNAFTFPLETLIFKAVVMAATGLKSDEVTVYGDDIIVPASHAETACKGLISAGFRPNWDKSYWGQHDDERKYFRESCGADWYRGHAVTPVYYRREAKTDQDLAVLFNRFVETWPSLTKVHELVFSASRRPLFGPRFILTDGDLSEGSTLWRDGLFNKVISLYDSYFWQSSVLSEEPTSNRRWTARSVLIQPRQYIDERTAELTFLLKGLNSVPNRKRVRVTRCNFVAVDAPETVRAVCFRFGYLNRRRSFHLY